MATSLGFTRVNQPIQHCCHSSQSTTFPPFCLASRGYATITIQLPALSHHACGQTPRPHVIRPPRWKIVSQHHVVVRSVPPNTVEPSSTASPQKHDKSPSHNQYTITGLHSTRQPAWSLASPRHNRHCADMPVCYTITNS
jgi:hypothetical protein